MRLQPLALADRQLGTGLLQVAGLEAVVHHGVVEHGADGALHHPRLLTALPTGVGEYEAYGDEEQTDMTNKQVRTETERSDATTGSARVHRVQNTDHRTDY